MKKLSIALAVLVSLAVASAVFLMRKPDAFRTEPAKLLPGNTFAYLEVLDLQRSRDRFEKTGLYALWQEPEVQKFLEQPRAKAPQMQEVNHWLDLMAKAKPRNGFIGVLSVEGNEPKIVGGFSYEGTRANLDALLEKPRAAMKQAKPLGKAEIVKHGEAEIQTFTADNETFAETVRDDWYFVSNDVASLNALLDRYEKRKAHQEGTLADDEIFRASRKPLPNDADGFGFVRMEAVYAKLAPLLSASGQAMDAETLAEWKRQKGVAGTLRMDGLNFEEMLYAYAPGGTAESKLDLPALAFTAPETLFFYTSMIPPNFAASIQKVAPMLGENGPMVMGVAQALTHSMSLAMEWGANPMPDLLASAGVAPGKSASLQAVLDRLLTSPTWNRAGEKPVVYTMATQPADGSGGAAPALPMAAPKASVALAEAYVLGGTAGGVQAALTRQGNKEDKLSSLQAYQMAAGAVPPPTSAFAFVNTGALFDKVYTLARPMLTLGLAFNPDAAGVVDASKLPSSAAIAKHLGAAAMSSSTTAEGRLVVSRGPVTMPQMLVVVGAAAGAAYPLIKDKLPPGLLPAGLGGGGASAPGAKEDEPAETPNTESATKTPPASQIAPSLEVVPAPR